MLFRSFSEAAPVLICVYPLLDQCRRVLIIPICFHWWLLVRQSLVLWFDGLPPQKELKFLHASDVGSVVSVQL